MIYDKRQTHLHCMFNIRRDGPIRSHLRNVYASIASASLMVAAGSIVHVNGKFDVFSLLNLIEIEYEQFSVR